MLITTGNRLPTQWPRKIKTIQDMVKVQGDDENDDKAEI